MGTYAEDGSVFDPETARLNALTALRAWTRQRDRMPEQRAVLLGGAWRAGERNIRELARIADVSRQTVYDDLRAQGIDPREDRDAAITPPRYAPLTYAQADELAEHMAAVLGSAMLASEPEPLASAAWWAAKAVRHIANLLDPKAPPGDANPRDRREGSLDTIADCAARLRRAVHTQWAAEATATDLARFTDNATQTQVELGESLPIDTVTMTVLLPDGMTKVPVTLTTAWNTTEPDGFWQWTADAPLLLAPITGLTHLEINALLTNLSELITQALHPDLLDDGGRL